MSRFELFFVSAKQAMRGWFIRRRQLEFNVFSSTERHGKATSRPSASSPLGRISWKNHHLKFNSRTFNSVHVSTTFFSPCPRPSNGLWHSPESKLLNKSFESRCVRHSLSWRENPWRILTSVHCDIFRKVRVNFATIFRLITPFGKFSRFTRDSVEAVNGEANLPFFFSETCDMTQSSPYSRKTSHNLSVDKRISWFQWNVFVYKTSPGFMSVPETANSIELVSSTKIECDMWRYEFSIKLISLF